MSLSASDVRFVRVPISGWLSVVRGRLWLTRRGDGADHFLEAGQSMRLDTGAELCLGAEPLCELQWLADPAAPGAHAVAQRLWQQVAAVTIAVRRRLPVAPQTSSP